MVLTKMIAPTGNEIILFFQFVIYVDLYCIADVPGMGIYFFSYEWVLNKLTLEGERFVEYRCIFVSSCRQF